MLVVVRSARMVLIHWKKAQAFKNNSLMGVIEPMEATELWVKPVRNQTKVNVDATTFEQEFRFGFGCVARNYEGVVVDMLAGCRDGRMDASMAETIGVSEALSWIKANNWSNVLVESDCLLAVQAINGKFQMSSSFGMIVEDCRMLLSELSNVCLSYVKCSANSAVHCIARASYYLPECGFEADDVSHAFSAIVQTELRN